MANTEYTFYKVMGRTKCGKLVSLLVKGRGRIVYRSRLWWSRWVRAPRAFRKQGYHVCVFANLTDARRFAWQLRQSAQCADYDGVEIWRVKAKGRVTIGYRPMTDQELLTHATPLEALKQKNLGSGWPIGTRMVKAIRLEEQVVTIKPEKLLAISLKLWLGEEGE